MENCHTWIIISMWQNDLNTNTSRSVWPILYGLTIKMLQYKMYPAGELAVLRQLLFFFFFFFFLVQHIYILFHRCKPTSNFINVCIPSLRVTSWNLVAEFCMSSTLAIGGTKIKNDRKDRNCWLVCMEGRDGVERRGITPSIILSCFVCTPLICATFFRGGWSWNIFYGYSLPSADSRRAVVSFWQKNVHNTS